MTRSLYSSQCHIEQAVLDHCINKWSVCCIRGFVPSDLPLLSPPQICGIIGGTFTVAGIIDSCIFTASEAWKKIQLGKLSWVLTHPVPHWSTYLYNSDSLQHVPHSPLIPVDALLNAKSHYCLYLSYRPPVLHTSSLLCKLPPSHPLIYFHFRMRKHYCVFIGFSWVSRRIFSDVIDFYSMFTVLCVWSCLAWCGLMCEYRIKSSWPWCHSFVDAMETCVCVC